MQDNQISIAECNKIIKARNEKSLDDFINANRYTKKCPKCGDDKPFSEFGENKSNKDGLSTYCKICKREYLREYWREYSKTPKYRKHKREYQREYRKTPKFRKYQREYQREYRKTPKFRKYQREYIREYQREKLIAKRKNVLSDITKALESGE